MNKESVSQIRRKFAVQAATARLAAIEVERVAIARAFPEIGAYDVPEAPQEPVRQTRGGKWTKARRIAHGKRIKAMWAARRKAAKGAKS
jgi:hypothetical protein